jgi:hypothetical protein
MHTVKRFRLGLFYVAIAVLGAGYGVLEQQEAIDWLTSSMKELSLPLMKKILPFCLPLTLALVVYGFLSSGRLSP